MPQPLSVSTCDFTFSSTLATTRSGREVADQVELRILLAADPRLGGDALRGLRAVHRASDDGVAEAEGKEDLGDAGDERDDSPRRRGKPHHDARCIRPRRHDARRPVRRRLELRGALGLTLDQLDDLLHHARAARRPPSSRGRPRQLRARPRGWSPRPRTSSGDDACCPRPCVTPTAEQWSGSIATSSLIDQDITADAAGSARDPVLRLRAAIV